MEAEVDDRVFDPMYDDGGMAPMTLPGHGALLAPTMFSAPDSTPASEGFQVSGRQLGSFARLAGETPSHAGSGNGSERTLVREGRPAEAEADIQRTPRSQLMRPSPSLSSMERGRPMVRGRASATRTSSAEESRIDQMALLMEAMMTRMERLEGSDRSSRRSGTSYGRSTRERLNPWGRNEEGSLFLGPSSEARVGLVPSVNHPGLPVSPRGPCSTHMPGREEQTPLPQVPSLSHRIVPHAAQVFQAQQAPQALPSAQVFQAQQAPQALPSAQVCQAQQAPQALPSAQVCQAQQALQVLPSAQVCQAQQAPQVLPSADTQVFQAQQALQALPSAEAQVFQAQQALQALPSAEAQVFQAQQALQALPSAEAQVFQAQQALQALPSADAQAFQAQQALQALPSADAQVFQAQQALQVWPPAEAQVFQAQQASQALLSAEAQVFQAQHAFRKSNSAESQASLAYQAAQAGSVPSSQALSAPSTQPASLTNMSQMSTANFGFGTRVAGSGPVIPSPVALSGRQVQDSVRHQPPVNEVRSSCGFSSFPASQAIQVARTEPAEVTECIRDRGESSQASFHSLAGSDVGVDPSPLTGPQHFYIGDAPGLPARHGQGLFREVSAVLERDIPTTGSKGTIASSGCPEEFPSPVRPNIVRYPATPGGTEIRPPATTPPITPVATRKQTPPSFGLQDFSRYSEEGFWMTGVPPPPPLPDFASASAQASQTVGFGVGLNTTSAQGGAPVVPLPLPPPLSAQVQGQAPRGTPRHSTLYPASAAQASGSQAPADLYFGASIAPPPPPPAASGFSGTTASGLSSSGGTGSQRVEEPSRYIQSLPKLEEYTPDQGAVILGDWLVTISPVVGSLSSGSAVWFSKVQSRVTEHYSKWLASDPVSRLSVRQAAIEDGALWARGHQYAMLEQRMTTLLLEAIPLSVKTEVVTVRALTTVGILFLLHTRYQPAGQAEKAAILQYLVNPETPKDLGSSVKNLRRWIRLLARSSELQLASPDASLLVKAVDRLGQPYLGDSAAVFRVQAFRLQHGVDHQPSYAIAVSLAQLYLAELETLALMAPENKKQKVAVLQEGKSQGSDFPPKPKGAKRYDKGHKAETPKDGHKETCRQFNTDKGCPRGNTCKYLHKPLEGGMTGRCFNCGGTHLKAECLSPGGGAFEKPTEKAPPMAKPKAKKLQGQVQGAPQSSAEEAPSTVAGPATTVSISETAALGPSATQALKEAASSLRQELLKAMKTAEDVHPEDFGTGGKGLIDGGATSCLRAAKNAFEWKEASPTTIRLAVGETEARTTASGTLLLPPQTPCDPIVALHELIRIGYRMTFLEVGRIRVWKPGRPDLQVDCSTGCPEVPVATALELIKEVERSKILQLERLSRLTQYRPSFEDALARLPESGEEMAAWFRTLVPSVPARLMVELAVPACKQARPFNRRRRRTLMAAKNVIVHLCPGKSRGMFAELCRQASWEVVEVDLEEDLHDPTVFGFLLYLASRGSVRAVVGGPPCRTFSALRHRSHGPSPVRGLGGESWGLATLTQAQQASTDKDSLLFIKMFMLASVARRTLRLLQGLGTLRQPMATEPFCFLLEQPEDPFIVLNASQDEAGRPYPSLWRWPAWEEWAAAEQASMLSLDQGPLGHARRKPTTLGLIGPGWALSPTRGPGCEPSQPPHPTQGYQAMSGEWASWAPGLQAAIVAFVGFQVSIARKVPSACSTDSSSSEAHSQEMVSTAQHAWARALSREESQRQAWAQHLAQDHLPRRRDCYHCLAGEFQQKAHRKIPVPQAYCLGVDLLGPLVPGEQEVGKPAKYGLVGVYTFPKVVAPLAVESSMPPAPHASTAATSAPAASRLSSSQEREDNTKVVVEGNQVVVEDPGKCEVNARVLPTKPSAFAHVAVVGSRPSQPILPVPISGPATGHACPPPAADGLAVGHAPVSVLAAEPLAAGSVPLPAPAAVTDSEDDRLSQLFPDDPPEDSDSDLAVFEVADSGHPLLEPLTPSAVRDADNQNAEFALLWRDQPLPAVPMLEVPYFVPLVDKSMKQVLEGLMRIHTEIRAHGLPLHRLHSDRGREFINHKVAAWALHHNVLQTSTSGDDWRANGRVENWVRLLKRSTRTLLVAHGSPPSQWAFAMRHCAARLQSAALGLLGVPQARLLPWNACLALRKRAWEHKKPWATRVTKAYVLCPSPMLRGGHLVRTDEGSFVHTEALVEVADTMELQEYAAPASATRVRGKRPLVVPPKAAAVASQVPVGLAVSSTCPFSSAGPVPLLHAGTVAVLQRGGDNNLPLDVPQPVGGQAGSGGEGEFLPLDVPQPVGGQAGSGGEGEFLPLDVPQPVGGQAGSGGECEFLLHDALQPDGVDAGSGGVNLPRQNCRGSILKKGCASSGLKQVRFDLPVHPANVQAPQELLEVTQSEMMAQALSQASPVTMSSVLTLLQVSGCQASNAGSAEWSLGIEICNEGPRVSAASRCRPFLTRLLCNAMKESHPGLPFTSLRILRNPKQSCRRDLTRAEGLLTLWTSLSRFKGGHLWVEEEEVTDDWAVLRQTTGDPDGFLRKGRVLPTQPQAAFDARRYHEVQEAQGDRWILEGFTPDVWHRLSKEDRASLADLGFPLPLAPSSCSRQPAVRVLAFRSEVLDASLLPAYECVGTSHVLRKCRASVMKVLDYMQDNLKRWAHEVKAFWGRANSQGDGDSSADLLRTTEIQICALQDTLSRARELEEQECPPLVPECRAKEIACFVEEGSFQERVCVAHMQEGTASATTRPTEVPLQTRTLTLAEVLAELEDWKPSWGEEYSSLVETHKAVTPIGTEDLQAWRSQGKKFQVIPSKLVHTRKAHTGRRKTRCVCCGNMEEVSLFNRHECYAGRVDATALRATLRMASAWDWSVSSFDVKTAFLQSRLLDKHDVPTVVKTPWLWRKHGVCQEEFWLVQGALYGLCISPRSWCESRDATMASATTQIEGKKVTMRCFKSDPNLWWVLGVDSEDKEVRLGMVAWYIDDALILAHKSLSRGITEFISSLWTTTPPEYLSSGQVLVYNGFEIEQEGSCIRLHQRSFLTELLGRYPGEEQADVPAIPLTPSEEEGPDLSLTRRCQALCGELLWLSIRTRPEICYAVNMMAQKMAKWPKEAWSRGLQVLKYLRRHPGVMLSYGIPKEGDLACAMAMSDASFAPTAERSHQCSMTFLGGSLITWHSTRQPFITQSTCEAELVALCSALSDVEAQLPLYQELLPSTEWKYELLCDNKSAVAICQAPFGSWRSRHLHLRANVIKERLSQGWTLKHQPGAEMLADIGTKPLASGRFLELVLGLGLHVPPSLSNQHQAKAVSLQTRFRSLDCVALDLGPVPAEVRCQSLLRALILLELISSLPVGESAPTAWNSTQTQTTLVWSCLAVSFVLASFWIHRPTRIAVVSTFVVGIGWAAGSDRWWTPPFWIVALVMGFALGWTCPRKTTKVCHDAATETTDMGDSFEPSTRSPQGEPRLLLGAEVSFSLHMFYADDAVRMDGSKGVCIPHLAETLSLRDFARLQFVCQELHGKVAVTLQEQDRDRSLLTQTELDFANIPGVIARSIGRASTYEPTNCEIRQWVVEFQEAEDRLIFGPDSEEEEYDPSEHVGFHAAVAAYYLVNLGYWLDEGEADPDFLSCGMAV